MVLSSASALVSSLMPVSLRSVTKKPMVTKNLMEHDIAPCAIPLLVQDLGHPSYPRQAFGLTGVESSKSLKIYVKQGICLLNLRGILSGLGECLLERPVVPIIYEET